MTGLRDAHDLSDDAEELRPQLLGLAHRLLGSAAEAQALVDEVLERLARTAPEQVLDLEPWLRTTLSRGALVRLRSRADGAPPVAVADPGVEAAMAGSGLSVDVALLVQLERLRPAERVAFVLHDLDGVHFEDVAGVLGRTAAAARDLAARARHRVATGTHDDAQDAGEVRRRAGVVADLHRALPDPARAAALLAPGVVLRADAAAVGAGLPWLAEGPADVAAAVAGLEVEPAVLDGYAALAHGTGGHPDLVLGLTLGEGGVTEVDAMADPTVLGLLDLAVR